MLTQAGGLFFVVLDFHGFKVFSLEDLAAIEAFDVVYAISSGDNLGPVVVTSGLHNQRLDETYSIQVQELVKPPGGLFRAGAGRDGRCGDRCEHLAALGQTGRAGWR